MSFVPTKTNFWPFKSPIMRDADALIAQWGSAAYEQASRLSVHEDFGLARTAEPGHWWRVQREVGRRFNRPDADSEVRFTIEHLPPMDGGSSLSI